MTLQALPEAKPESLDEAAVLVIGSGIAGLTFALKTAPLGRVVVITKKDRATSNTNWARGGIAAGLGEDDDPELHLEDTLRAGGGLSNATIARGVVEEGPARVRELLDWGVRFRREGEVLALGMEGGHSRRRILSAGDRTGREIERALLAAVAADPRIRVVEHLFALDLLVCEGPDGRACAGALALDTASGALVEVRAPVTLLASGGCGQLYRYTTNPVVATGDGIAMAWRAGVPVANLEFIQFHPTALWPAEDPAFLLTEALRGEGARLRTIEGRPLMEGVDPRGSLAPRDIVARAIHEHLLETGDPYVVLDVSAIGPETMAERFPGALQGCRERGVDLFGEGIPVVPAAHYICGGVVTDPVGRTALPGLLASGEVAHTGLHGANRLASNSLLEAVVFSHRAASLLLEEGLPELPALGASAVVAAPGREAPTPDRARLALERERLRTLMWEGVGIVRTDARLEQTAAKLEELLDRLARLEPEASGGAPGVEMAELRNLATVGCLVTACARSRLESRGLHFNRDHPEADDAFVRDTVLVAEARRR